MRKLIAVILGFGFLAVAACGSSDVSEDSCNDVGGLCVKTGAACGDTLPYTCPSGGTCCSPTSQSQPAAEKTSPEPAAR